MAVAYKLIKEERKRNLRREMLSEWYGEDYANVEIVAHGNRPTRLDDCLDDFCREVFGDNVRRKMELEHAWPEIAGKQLAALTSVAAFIDGVLELAVKHPAFLRELDGTTDLIVERVNSRLGGDFCRKVKFVASGGDFKR